jgi:hypothetical protein
VHLGKPNDPHWDLVIEIAARLWIDGEYAVELPVSPTQPYVDLQWAARQAGRVLGGRSKVRIWPRRGFKDRRVVVKVTYVDPDGHGLERAEESLEELMRVVLEQHGIG